MKILVPIKRVVDYSVCIRVKADGSGVDTSNVKMSMNPPDENAVEEAIRLVTSGVAEEAIAVSVGGSKTSDTLRTALAMGIDRGIHVHCDDALEPLAIAKVLKEIALRECCKLVLAGKQAIDDDSNQCPQKLAALLGWPQATFASQLTINDTELTVVREIDGGLLTLKLDLPAVVSCDLRLNEPRHPTLPGIMQARKKPLQVIELAALGLNTENRLRVLETISPPQRSKGMKVASASELVDCLREKTEVLQ